MSLVIDVHGHLMPDSVFDKVPEPMSVIRRDESDRALVVDGVRGRFAPLALRQADVRAGAQAARGVDVSIVGPWIDMVKAAPTASVQVDWCRILTDALCQESLDRPELRFLAALPERDGGAAAEELSRAVELGAVGGLLATTPHGGGLNETHYDALWEAAEHLGVPLILHPGYFQPPENMRDFYLANSVGNPFETTIAVGRLIGADVPGRFPDLKLVLTHGGGFFPYQFARMDAAFSRWPANSATKRRMPRELLNWFWYDTVMFAVEPLRYLLDLVGSERVLAGTDCPFMMADYRAFEASEDLGLSQAESAAMLGGNAAELFGIRA